MRIHPFAWMICLLAGCAVFTLPETSKRHSTGFESVAAGQWCRVEMDELKSGLSRTHIEHIGRVETFDRESITLSDVTTHVTNESPAQRIPYLERLFKNTGVTTPDEAAPITLPRDGIAHVTPISSAEARQLKQPAERRGVNFDFDPKSHRQDNSRTTLGQFPPPQGCERGGRFQWQRD